MSLTRPSSQWIAPDGSLPVVEISKLELMERLDALGKWEAFKGLISSLPEKTQDGWNLAQFIRSDHPLFVQSAPIIKKILDLTDEEFDALLS